MGFPLLIRSAMTQRCLESGDRQYSVPPPESTSKQHRQDGTITFGADAFRGRPGSSVLDWSTVSQFPTLLPKRLASFTR
jgi:hypothetical protein